ncbi:hypothetical protein [Streptomyces sp. DH12]|uniref:hypothetical protein n=1 Tax=Streptomyces sp. DH12 TaxID=2857010 RepID=UPI001E47686D|nr:hypothetical protein [Streptomyces sp. DH12]
MARRPHRDTAHVELRIRTHYGDLAFFSMIATFGAPEDVTLSEVGVEEAFFPVDGPTEALLRRLSG